MTRLPRKACCAELGLQFICVLRRIAANIHKIEAVVMTPLKKARKENGWRLSDLVSRLKSVGEETDTGNLSRIERGLQRASPQMAESLCNVFGKEKLTEMHVLYPLRFAEHAAA
jgi:predicted transcriptional regulator